MGSGGKLYERGRILREGKLEVNGMGDRNGGKTK